MLYNEITLKKAVLPMNLGEKIKIARDNAGLTQEELGKKCGTTKQTIFKYETGVVTNIPIDRLELIAEAVGVSAASLLGWESKQPTVSDGLSDLDREIIERLTLLTPEELEKVDAFVQGILAAR